jgi:hypothetical protein
MERVSSRAAGRGAGVASLDDRCVMIADVVCTLSGCGSGSGVLLFPCALQYFIAALQGVEQEYPLIQKVYFPKTFQSEQIYALIGLVGRRMCHVKHSGALCTFRCPDHRGHLYAFDPQLLQSRGLIPGLAGWNP